MIKNINPGVYPTMLTPFTADNKIDYGAVEQLLSFYADNGVSGIFAICQSSEIFYLSFEERLGLLRFIMEHKPEGVSIVASGHTADDTDRQIYEANAFIDTGIDAYVFIANRLAKEDEDDSVFLKNYEKFVSSIPEIGLGIYECPYPYKRLMQPETLAKCCEIGNLLFIKDTCSRIEMIKAKLEATEGTGLKIFNANGATLLESLKLGCAGYSGVMANFHPEIYAWLCGHFNENSEKVKLAADFLSFASTVESRQYPVNAKYHLSLRGVDMLTKSRVCDDSSFAQGNKMEMQAMITVENTIKTALGI
ncbi:MAG: dihydrodipicolinate synthase family protein [Clostridia bacterium]|nr:dihydrodipicolinate synthase family protein [Clostridia bacterium]